MSEKTALPFARFLLSASLPWSARLDSHWEKGLDLRLKVLDPCGIKSRLGSLMCACSGWAVVRPL